MANAATAAAFLFSAGLASTLGTTAAGLKLVLAEGVEKAVVHAMIAAKRKAMVWKVFMMFYFCKCKESGDVYCVDHNDDGEEAGNQT